MKDAKSTIEQVKPFWVLNSVLRIKAVLIDQEINLLLREVTPGKTSW